jgi:cell division protein FtsB
MPPARSATSAARATRASSVPRTQSPRARTTARPSAPRTVPPRLYLSKIKWARKFRAVMLVVLAFVGWLGVQGAMTLIATRAQAEQQQAIVHQLAAQNRRLAAEQDALSQPTTIVRAARSLGMVRANERAYAVTGLPGR